MICPTCGHDNLPGIEACGNCQQDLTPLDRPVAGSKVERSLMEDTVEALPVHAPLTLLPSATIRQAIALLLEHNVGALLVVDDQGKLLGIFSERDLLKKVACLHPDYADLPVERFMTPRPQSVSLQATLDFVLHKMDGGGYRHVPVVSEGKPLGVLSIRDMLRHLTRLCS
jgi:CBS domain-containing protein